MLDSSLVTGTIEIGSCTVSETERKEMWARKPLYSGDSDICLPYLHITAKQGNYVLFALDLQLLFLN